MLEAVNWLWFLAGFATCIFLQWLWSAYWISDWVLRVFRRGHLADLIGSGLVWALVIAAVVVAVWAAGEALQLMAVGIRGRY